MLHDFASQKPNRLFVILGGFFIVNALVAEFIGVKIFSLEPSLGIPSFNWSLFGQNGSLMFTAGVLLWPVVFIMTDILNEYFGTHGVRFLSRLTAGLISYAFLMVFMAIRLHPADFWLESNAGNGLPDMQLAYQSIFGQSLWIIIGSLVAFLIGQLVDVLVFHKIKEKTGEKHLYLRSTGSTVVSQFIDSYVVLYIAFVIGPQKWPIALFLAIGTVNYLYKLGMAVILTPVIYAVHYIIESYLGQELADKMKKRAMQS